MVHHKRERKLRESADQVTQEELQWRAMHTHNVVKICSNSH